jgi:aminoglycoside phosphotransferase (APT) family kinase protein
VSTPARDVRAVLEESGPDYDDFSFERPTAGHQGEVFLVTLVHQGEEYEVVIKFQTDGDDGAFAIEPYLHEYVADRTDVPVPRILIYQDDPVLDVPPYFVTERVEGQNLAESLAAIDPDIRGRVVEQAGRILGDMHAEIAFEGFGRLGLSEERLVVENLTWDWRGFFRDIAEGYIQNLANSPFEDLQDRAQGFLDQSIDVVPSEGVPRLVHDDFRPANMLFDQAAAEPITAVLDWQFALAGDPAYHLARTDFLFIDPAFADADTRDALRERLYAGYREYREFEPDAAYERQRAVYHFATLLWRMASFEAAFAEQSGLAQARAEARFRQQFDALARALPEP